MTFLYTVVLALRDLFIYLYSCVFDFVFVQQFAAFCSRFVVDCFSLFDRVYCCFPSFGRDFVFRFYRFVISNANRDFSVIYDVYYVFYVYFFALVFFTIAFPRLRLLRVFRWLIPFHQLMLVLPVTSLLFYYAYLSVTRTIRLFFSMLDALTSVVHGSVHNVRLEHADLRYHNRRRAASRSVSDFVRQLLLYPFGYISDYLAVFFDTVPENAPAGIYWAILMNLITFFVFLASKGNSKAITFMNSIVGTVVTCVALFSVSEIHFSAPYASINFIYEFFGLDSVASGLEDMRPEDCLEIRQNAWTDWLLRIATYFSYSRRFLSSIRKILVGIISTHHRALAHGAEFVYYPLLWAIEVVVEFSCDPRGTVRYLISVPSRIRWHYRATRDRYVVVWNRNVPRRRAAIQIERFRWFIYFDTRYRLICRRVDGWKQSCARMRNRIMHSLNGNIDNVPDFDRVPDNEIDESELVPVTGTSNWIYGDSDNDDWGYDDDDVGITEEDLKNFEQSFNITPQVQTEDYLLKHLREFEIFDFTCEKTMAYLVSSIPRKDYRKVMRYVETGEVVFVGFNENLYMGALKSVLKKAYKPKLLTYPTMRYLNLPERVFSRMSQIQISAQEENPTTHRKKSKSVMATNKGRSLEEAEVFPSYAEESDRCVQLKPNSKYKDIPKVDKPRWDNYTTSSMRTWVEYKAAAIFPWGNPRSTHAVYMSHAVWLLLKSRTQIHVSELKNLLDKSYIWYAPKYNQTLQLPTSDDVMLCDYLGLPEERFIDLNGDKYTADGFPALEHLFRRHKPIYRSCMEYLRGKDSYAGKILDRYTLQAQIKEKKIYQGNIPPVKLTVVATCCNKSADPTSVPSDADSNYQVGFSEMGNPVAFVFDILATLNPDSKEYHIYKSISRLSLPTDDIKMLVRVACLMMQLADASSWAVRCSALISFVTAESELKYLLERILVVRKALTDRLYQSSDAPIMTNLMEIISMVSVAKILTVIPGFSATWMAGIVKSIVGSIASRDIREFNHKVYAIFEETVSRLQRCIEKRSFSPLFNPDIRPSDWLLRANALTAYKNALVIVEGQDVNAQKKLMDGYVIKKLIPSYWNEPITHWEWKEQVELCLSQYAEVSTVAPKDSLSKMKKVLTTELENSLDTSSSQAMRVQPFMVALMGPPGTGKTNLGTCIAQSVGNRRGWNTDPEAFWHFDSNSNFQNNFSNHQWFAVMDDIDQDGSKPVRGQSDHVKAVMSVVDNKPFPVDKAAVEDKGKYAVKVVAGVYNTNYHDFRLEGYSLEPLAFFRRIPIRAFVSVRPEYASGGIVDPSKVGMAKNGDFYSITVQELNPSLYSSKQKFSTACYQDVPGMVGVGRAMFLHYINFRYDEHMNAQRLKLARALSSTFCTSCGVSLEPGGLCCGDADEIFATYEPPQTPVHVGPDPEAEAAERASATVERDKLFKQQRSRRKYQSGMDMVADVIQLPAYQSVYNYMLLALCFTFLHTLYKIGGAASTAERTVRSLGTFGKVLGCLTITATGISVLQGLRGVYSSMRGYFYQSRVRNVDDKIPPNFFGADMTQEESRSKPTWTPDELFSTTKYAVWVSSASAGHAIPVGGNSVLVNRHYFFTGDTQGTGIPLDGKRATVEIQGIKSIVTLDSTNHAPVSDDLVLLKVPEISQPRDFSKKFVSVEDRGLSVIDQIFICLPDGTVKDCGKGVIYSGDNGHKLIRYEYAGVSELGDCGTALVGRYGNEHFFVGVHSRANIGVFLDRALINSALECVSGVKYQSMPLKSTPLVKKPEKQYGEVREAMKNGFSTRYLGELVKPIGSTLESKVFRLPMAPYFKELEVEFCGQEKYFCRPTFKGHKIGEEGATTWQSPYTHSLLPIERAHPDNFAYYSAILDYVAGSCGTVRHGYSVLSEHEAIAGVKEAGIVPLNLRTSMGFPEMGPKSKHFIRKVEGDSVATFISEHACKELDEIYAVLANGDIPLPTAVDFLKDEPISFSKAKERKVRLFSALPACYNIVIKRFLTPVTKYMRNNVKAFECCIGINMCDSSELETLVKDVGEGVYFQEGDYEKQDKRESGYALYGVSLVKAFLAHTLGMDGWKVYRISMGTVFCFRSTAGEFHQPNGTNVSGQGLTGEDNSIHNSLCHRYDYYKQRPLPQDKILEGFQLLNTDLEKFQEWINGHCDLFTFRNKVKLRTYGDDFFRNVEVLMKEGLDINGFEKNARDFGHKITDGQDKSAFMRVRPRHEISFLKRKVVYSEDFGSYVSPLDQKSIVKMLTVGVSGTLTTTDLMAVLASNALRECVYHGEGFFNRVYAMVLEADKECNFSLSVHFLKGDYSVYKGWVQKNKTTWT